MRNQLFSRKELAMIAKRSKLPLGFGSVKKTGCSSAAMVNRIGATSRRGCKAPGSISTARNFSGLIQGLAVKARLVWSALTSIKVHTPSAELRSCASTVLGQALSEPETIATNKVIL